MTARTVRARGPKPVHAAFALFVAGRVPGRVVADGGLEVLLQVHAQIRDLLALDPASAAERIRDYWAGTEREHAARRELAGYLVDRLYGKKPAMYEVAVRDIPARSLLSLMRRAHQDEVLQLGREFFIHRMMRGGVARVEGIAGAPFTIYHGEVSGDSDGPVEFCWPVPGD